MPFLSQQDNSIVSFLDKDYKLSFSFDNIEKFATNRFFRLSQMYDNDMDEALKIAAIESQRPQHPPRVQAAQRSLPIAHKKAAPRHDIDDASDREHDTTNAARSRSSSASSGQSSAASSPERPSSVVSGKSTSRSVRHRSPSVSSKVSHSSRRLSPSVHKKPKTPKQRSDQSPPPQRVNKRPPPEDKLTVKRHKTKEVHRKSTSRPQTPVNTNEPYVPMPPTASDETPSTSGYIPTPKMPKSSAEKRKSAPRPAPSYIAEPPPTFPPYVPLLRKNVDQFFNNPQDDDNFTSVSCDTKTRTVNKKRTLNIDDLYEELHEDLKENTLAKNTVMAIFNNSLKDKTKASKSELCAEIGLISTTSFEDPGGVSKSNWEKWGLPEINMDNYLFSKVGKKFGSDKNTVDVARMGGTQKDQGNCTLEYALTGSCKDSSPDFSDVVFRRALRKVSLTMFDVDLSMPVTHKTPSFISAQLIELEVCYNFAQHYHETLKLDIVEHLTKGMRTAGLNNYVKDSQCVGFITTLLMSHRVYDYNELSDRLSSYVGTPKCMRIWTTHAKQTEINNSLTAFAHNILAEKTKEWGTDSDPKKKIREYTIEYVTKFQHFLARYASFLSTVLRESELFAWMCFGVAMDDDTGMAVHATSFYAAAERSLDRIKDTVSFNYVIASQLAQRRAPESRPIVKLDDYLNNVDDLLD